MSIPNGTRCIIVGVMDAVLQADLLGRECVTVEMLPIGTLVQATRPVSVGTTTEIGYVCDVAGESKPALIAGRHLLPIEPEADGELHDEKGKDLTAA